MRSSAERYMERATCARPGLSRRQDHSCHQVHADRLHGDRGPPQRQGMTTFTQLTSTSLQSPKPFTDQLWLAVAAYLARFKGSSREHTESDLRCYLTWCAERGLDPLATRRSHLGLYIRWMQEIRRFTATPITSSPPSWPPAPDWLTSPGPGPGDVLHCRCERVDHMHIYAQAARNLGTPLASDADRLAQPEHGS